MNYFVSHYFLLSLPQITIKKAFEGHYKDQQGNLNVKQFEKEEI